MVASEGQQARTGGHADAHRTQRRYDPMIDQIDSLLHYQNVVDRAFPAVGRRVPPRRPLNVLPIPPRPPLSQASRVGRVARQRGDEFIRGISIREPGGPWDVLLQPRSKDDDLRCPTGPESSSTTCGDRRTSGTACGGVSTVTVTGA